jgi:hypothetical protein
MNSLDGQLVKKHLDNRAIYQPCHDLTRKTDKDINEVWKYVAKKNRENERHVDRLRQPTDLQHLSGPVSTYQNTQIS